MVKRIYLPRNLFKTVTAISTIRLMITMLAPVGRFISNDRISPARKQITDRKTDNSATALKLTTSLRAITAGKMIKLEIRRLPIIRIPITTVNAVSSAIKNF